MLRPLVALHDGSGIGFVLDVVVRLHFDHNCLHQVFIGQPVLNGDWILVEHLVSCDVHLELRVFEFAGAAVVLHVVDDVFLCFEEVEKIKHENN